VTGWRARLGVLYPADGDLDTELWRFVPPGVSLHITRTPGAKGTITVRSVTAEAESPALEAAARLLCTIRLDCLSFLCTAMSFVRGPGYDTEIIERLRTATGIPSTTTSTALLEALRVLGVHQLAIVAPYPKPVTDCLVAFLEGNGLEVLNSHAMGIDTGANIGEVTPGEVYRIVRASDVPDAECIFVSCTALRTVEVLEALEQDLGKPVLSANQVTLWHSLLLAGVHETVPHVGRILTELPDR
jgi:maleate isomerase